MLCCVNTPQFVYPLLLTTIWVVSSVWPHEETWYEHMCTNLLVGVYFLSSRVNTEDWNCWVTELMYVQIYKKLATFFQTDCGILYPTRKTWEFWFLHILLDNYYGEPFWVFTIPVVLIHISLITNDIISTFPVPTHHSYIFLWSVCSSLLPILKNFLNGVLRWAEHFNYKA